MMKKILLTFGALLTLFACGGVVEVTPELREAADGYLTLLDRGQNEEVWHRYATIFKESVTLDAWIKQVEQLKKPLGKAKTRMQRDAIGQQDPTNHPPGEYVMMNFETGFENDEVLETLVLFRQDQKWLLAGYFLK